MNAILQMEAVNTIAMTPLGVSTAAVTQGTSWMKMDSTVVVRVYSLIIWHIFGTFLVLSYFIIALSFS